MMSESDILWFVSYVCVCLYSFSVVYIIALYSVLVLLCFCALSQLCIKLYLVYLVVVFCFLFSNVSL